jgi:hypothetical protein
MFSTLSELAKTEDEKKKARDLEQMRESEARSKDRRRIVEAEQALLNSKAEAQRRKIERDALQQRNFLEMSQRMEENALLQVTKAAERARREESVQKHVFETLFAEVMEESNVYNDKIALDMSDTTLPQNFSYAYEPEPARDSDDDDEAPKQTKKRVVEQPKSLLSFLPF